MIELKTPEDIEGIRQSAQILSIVFKHILDAIEPGITPIHLNTIAEKVIHTHGATPSFKGYQGYPAALCISPDEVVIHGIPDNTQLREGQIVGIDCGVSVNGYISDAALTIPIGKVTSAAKKLLNDTKQALTRGIEAAQKGKYVSDISRAIFDHISAIDSYGIVTDFCGHGVGFAVHEEPEIPNYVNGRLNRRNVRLKTGMVIAIEPMVTLGSGKVYVGNDNWKVITADKTLSAHFEHTIAILDNGPEVLTHW